MASFSERMGYVPQKAIQIEKIDIALLNLLWNETEAWLNLVGGIYSSQRNEELFYRWVWVEFFKKSYDTFLSENAKLSGHIDQRRQLLISKVRSYLFDPKTPWHGVFDLIEFLIDVPFEVRSEKATADSYRKNVIGMLNIRLEQEKSGYRILNKQFVPITNSQELATVEKAIQPTLTAMTPVAIQLQQALAHLADRTQPDYRNSMKESISAVESLCKLVAKMPNATLSPALEKTTKELGLNENLREGFKSIYKYTSDDHGIRHGLKDEEQPEQEDAQFFLVACSAFVNFITEKARKLGKL